MNKQDLNNIEYLSEVRDLPNQKELNELIAQFNFDDKDYKEY